MKEVFLYTTRICPFCLNAKALLKRKGIEPTEIPVDDPEKRREMMELTGQRTVPQIFIGTKHVGGFTELAQLEKERKLDGLLSE